MKTKKLILFVKLLIVFAIFFNIVLYIGYKHFNKIDDLFFLYENKYENTNSFSDYNDLTARMRVLYAKSDLSFFKKNYGDLTTIFSERDIEKIKEIFSKDNSQEYYKDFLKAVPNSTELFNRLKEKRTSLIKEIPKYSFFRIFAKKTGAYAINCVLTGKEEEFVESIDKLAGVTLIFSWGKLGKPDTINLYIGIAMRKIIQEVIDFGISPNKNEYLNYNKNLDFKLTNDQKKILSNILIKLNENFPTLIEAFNGERIKGKLFTDYLNKEYPFSTFCIDILANPFSNTMEVLNNYYDETIEALKNNTDYQKIYSKYSNKWNPLVKVCVVKIERPNKYLNELSDHTNTILEKLK